MVGAKLTYLPDSQGLTTPAFLQVSGLKKVYTRSSREPVEAVSDLTFDVAEREIVCLVGPSGCGKTTTLRLIAGLLEPSEGSVSLGGQRVEGTPDGMAVVFQDYSRSLFPWFTVKKNVTVPLRVKGIPRKKREALAERALGAVGLLEAVERYPWQLSGGMQQRVAIARALAYQPSILLMDEPFASVDAQTRADLEDLLLQVHSDFGVTVLLVTHDVDEAVYLGDRVVILTRRPSVVRDVVHVNIERPRSQLETRESPEFVDLRARVYRGVRGLEP